MFRFRTLIAALLLMTPVIATAAFADDWVAVKMRGTVFTYVEGSWVRLQRGDVVPDTRIVRTQPSGHVLFQRDAETIEVGASTQISIVDRAGHRYTTVKQYYGTVEIEAEVQNVQHFSVQTPYLAAIVKGTNFVVTSDGDSSKVVVKRGRVQVQDLSSHQQVLITVGQSAETHPGDGLSVGGKSVSTSNTPLDTGLPDPGGYGVATNGGTTTGVGPVGVGTSNGGEVGVAGPSGNGTGVTTSGGGVAVGVTVSSGSTGALGASAEVGVPGTSGVGVAVTTGSLLGSGDQPAAVTVQTPLGGGTLSLPLGGLHLPLGP